MEHKIPEAPQTDAPCWYGHDEASAWENGHSTGWEKGYAAALAALQRKEQSNGG